MRLASRSKMSVELSSTQQVSSVPEVGEAMSKVKVRRSGMPEMLGTMVSLNRGMWGLLRAGSRVRLAGDGS